MVLNNRLRAWGLVVLFAWQTTAFGGWIPGLSLLNVKHKKTCAVLVGGTLTVAGVLGYYYWTFDPAVDNTPIELKTFPAEEIPTEKEVLTSRIHAFDGLLDRDRRLVLPLKDDKGKVPAARLFDKNWLQRLVADSVKKNIKQKHPEATFADGPGFEIPLVHLAFQEDGEDDGAVFVSLAGNAVELSSTKSFPKAVLLTGNPFPVTLAHAEPIEGGGEAVTEVKLAVRFNVRTGRFEILDCKSSFRFTIAAKGVNEKDTVTFPPSQTAVVPLPLN